MLYPSKDRISEHIDKFYKENPASLYKKLENGKPTMKIYLASSWRDAYFNHVLDTLHSANHGVHGSEYPESCFDWDKISAANVKAIDDCDVLVLLLPCDGSAHIEFGFAAGCGKRCYILRQCGRSALPDDIHPEFMYILGRDIFDNVEDLIKELKL